MRPGATFSSLISPLTRDQKDIYFEQILHPECALFHVGAAIYVAGLLDLKLFLESVREVYQECPDACASIIPADGVPSQEVPEIGECDAGYSDLRGCDAPQEEALRLIREDFRKPVPFGDSFTSTRNILFHLADRKYIWYNRAHHILQDGWTSSLLYRHIVSRYNCKAHGHPYDALLAPRFADYAREDQAYERSSGFLRSKAWWEERFAEAPVPLFERRHALTFEAARETFFINRPSYDRIEALCRDVGVTTFHFLLASLIVTLSKESGAVDIAIALPILNRRSASRKKSIGLFVSLTTFLSHLERRGGADGGRGCDIPSCARMLLV
jgi:hypothetical protein